jgi:acyl carrier protein
MNTLNTIASQVSQVVLDVMPTIAPEMLQENTDIFSLGLDSINALRLILHLQSTFDVTFSGTDINFSNFQTVEKMASLIDSKLVGLVAA